MSSAQLRRLRESDLGAALALLRTAVPGPAFADPLVPVLESAALAPSMENQGLVAELDGALVGAAVYGEYAGTEGAGRLHLVAVAERWRRNGLGALLLQRVNEELTARAARFILAELPDVSPALDSYMAFLRAHSFIEEARIPDFHRPGAALVLLRREVSGHPSRSAR